MTHRKALDWLDDPAGSPFACPGSEGFKEWRRRIRSAAVDTFRIEPVPPDPPAWAVIRNRDNKQVALFETKAEAEHEVYG